MPTIKYKPSADCAYTQLISKIKGVHEQVKPPAPEIKSTNESKNNVIVKNISNGLMLAQAYNSESEDDEDSSQENNNGINHKSTEDSQASLQSIATLSDEIPIPPEIQCPPPELRVIVDKTASYVLKNGKDFEEILRAKNDQRFTFLQYKDPYYKYYTFKLTGIVCPDPPVLSTNNAQPRSTSNLRTFENKPHRTFDTPKPIGNIIKSFEN